MTQAVRRALITGGSRGIGAAVCRRLAADGFAVIINYHSRSDAAESVAEDIRAAGGEAVVRGFDVSDREATGAALEGLLSEDERPIAVIVNNAGVARDAVLPRMTWQQWHAVTRTTLDGFYNVTQPLVMPMIRHRWGRIINMSSISAEMGNQGQVNYSAAKAGLLGATRSLAVELARRKITVNAVTPGLIDTEMIENVPDFVVKQIPARRIGKPEEVAALVGFLASDDAAYINGQVIGINGGWH